MFKADINLDDPAEVEEWIGTHGTIRGKALANRLGFKGKGCVAAANSLANYAWSKQTAIGCRGRGDIQSALMYEGICDRIYSDDIDGVIDCW